MNTVNYFHYTSKFYFKYYNKRYYWYNYKCVNCILKKVYKNGFLIIDENIPGLLNLYMLKKYLI